MIPDLVCKYFYPSPHKAPNFGFCCLLIQLMTIVEFSPSVCVAQQHDTHERQRFSWQQREEFWFSQYVLPMRGHGLWLFLYHTCQRMACNAHQMLEQDLEDDEFEKKSLEVGEVVCKYHSYHHHTFSHKMSNATACSNGQGNLSVKGEKIRNLSGACLKFQCGVNGMKTSLIFLLLPAYQQLNTLQNTVEFLIIRTPY